MAKDKCGAAMFKPTSEVFMGAQVTYAGGTQRVHGVKIATGTSTVSLDTAAIDLDPGEFLNHISGTNLTSAGSDIPVRVASLTFSTNKRVYGPFGVPTTSSPFEVQGPVYSLHGAVARGQMSEVLAAIGFWTAVPAGRQLAPGRNWTVIA
jgi:hypothetical protein